MTGCDAATALSIVVVVVCFMLATAIDRLSRGVGELIQVVHDNAPHHANPLITPTAARPQAVAAQPDPVQGPVQEEQLEPWIGADDVLAEEEKLRRPYTQGADERNVCTFDHEQDAVLAADEARRRMLRLKRRLSG